MGHSEAAHASAEDASGDEEFDPIGTLTLIGIYFVLLLLGWVYIYFIEFLGRDLVVIG